MLMFPVKGMAGIYSQGYTLSVYPNIGRPQFK